MERKRNPKKENHHQSKEEAPNKHINSLNPKSSPTKTWAFAKAWTRETSPPDLFSSPIKDPKTRLLTTDFKEKARILACQYDHSDGILPDNPRFEQYIRKQESKTDSNGLNTPITERELKYGMGNLKSNAMGQDKVHNLMLKNLSEDNKKYLLDLLNGMLESAYVPQDWKKATIIPIRKPEKPAEEPESYRPISLTSCLGKVMERIINRRMVWLLESKGLRLKTQSGFRKGRSTMDNIIGLEHYIRKGFNKINPMNTYAVFLDISKAFDTTWIQGLLYKLSAKGITEKTLAWLKNFLTNRTFNVQIGQTVSEDRELKIGVPQGSPLSPLLFSVMLDDLPIIKEPGETLLFADDIECHILAENGRDAEVKLTPYLDEVTAWAKKWRFKFSAPKSSLINFTRQKKKQINPLLFISGSKIPEVKEIKHLGVYFDHGLRWTRHTAAVIKKTSKLKNLFKILTNTKHGPSIDSLVIMYKALVRSRIDYGIMVAGTSNQNRQKKIEAIQNGIMRIILGAPQSTPIKEMLLELDLQPITTRKSWLSGRYLIRVDKQPNHPMHQPCYNLRRKPINWKEHNTPALKLATAHTILADLNLYEEAKAHESRRNQPPPWTEMPITLDYLQIGKKEALANQTKATALFQEYKAQTENGTEAYTDGSLNKETKNTTCAVVLPTLNIEEAGTLTEGSSIFTAEAYGIHRAMEIVYNLPQDIQELIVYTDSKSVVKALASPENEKHHVIHDIIQTALNLKSSGTKTRICWIPSHVGIPGNERADTIASQESSSNESSNRSNNPLSISEQTAIYKHYLKKTNMEELKMGHEKENIHRRTQTGSLKWHRHKSRKITQILFRLRTGHNRLKAQMARLMPQENPNCLECEEPETTEHALLHCTALEMERLELTQYFREKNLNLNLPNVLGLNFELDHRTQFEIQHHLVRYIKNSRLINRI